MLWVEVLNRALDWRDTRSPERDPQAAQAAPVFEPEALRAAQTHVTLLRRVFASQYLDTPLVQPEFDSLNQWLAAVTLHVAPSRSVAGALSLIAARPRGAHGQPIENALSNALIQLLAESRSGGPLTAVHRCHGVLRSRRAAAGGLDTAWPPEFEDRFAHAAGITPLLRDGAWQQCPRLVVSERGSRYCSKACSNAHFAARKSQSDPAYFAQKQKRYRRRQEKNPAAATARLDRGAFVYMD